MSISVDLAKRQLTASIRALCRYAEDDSRGPDSAGGVAHLRAKLGQDRHRRYRDRRAAESPPGAFASEVSVTLTRVASPATRGFSAVLRGRADGTVLECRDGRETLVVEEVKSVALTAAELAALRPDDVPAYALQVKLYALALATQRPTARVRARLILMSVLDDHERAVEVEVEPAAVHAELDQLLCRAVEDAQRRRQRSLRRAACGERLRFPYPVLRAPQEALIEAFASGLASARPVLAAAPTGVGKTAAALFAGLRYALAQGTRLYYTTSKNTQKPHVAATFGDIAQASGLAPEDITAVTLRAKDQMCPPGTLACHPEHCSYLRDYRRRSRRGQVAAELVASEHHVGADAVYQRAVSLHLCPFALMREVAAEADVVICDYNQVYDRGAAAGSPDLTVTGTSDRDGDAGADEESPDAERGPLVTVDEAHNLPVVIVDEAHNLIDRARGYDSPSVRRAECQLVSRRLSDGFYEHAPFAEPAGEGPAPRAATGDLSRDRALSDDLIALCEQLIDEIDAAYEAPARAGHSFVDDSTPFAAAPLHWHALAERAARLLLRFALHCQLHRLIFPRDPLIELLRSVMHIGALLVTEAPQFISYVSGPEAPQGAAIGVMCVDPAQTLADRHVHLGGLLAMSASLAPLAYHRDSLGLHALAGDRDTAPITLSLPPPFPEEHREVVVIPTVTTTARERERDAPAIAQLIDDIISTRPGRYAVYFSSFAYLSRVRSWLRVPAAQTLVQVSNMPGPVRAKLLARLREQPGPTLLLAVLGGIFAEGIDLPGDELIGAIIVGPGLSPPSFERALMRAYFDDRGGDGFARAMLYPGMQRVVQAAGRVIRSEHDRGVIALVGSRFADPDYLRCLPDDWYRYRPEELITDDPVPRLIAFWASHSDE
ncbi:MAG: ATP-dependent DNA helicase [Haliangiales bacterium]